MRVCWFATFKAATADDGALAAALLSLGERPLRGG